MWMLAKEAGTPQSIQRFLILPLIREDDIKASPDDTSNSSSAPDMYDM
jgi:hypothetical protein